MEKTPNFGMQYIILDWNLRNCQSLGSGEDPRTPSAFNTNMGKVADNNACRGTTVRRLWFVYSVKMML